jgi:5-(carboxyamino)imidazole ribonucleotide mutase
MPGFRDHHSAWAPTRGAPTIIASKSPICEMNPPCECPDLETSFCPGTHKGCLYNNEDQLCYNVALRKLAIYSEKRGSFVTSKKIIVGVIMGSQSDWETLEHCTQMLDSLQVNYEARVVSAHRTPDLLFEYAENAASRGIEVIIAGAGGAAHLPGMAAAKTHLPVIGVPIQSKSLQGLDSLLSIVQMPAGIPVATVAIGKAGAINAALLAAAILGGKYPHLQQALIKFRAEQTNRVLQHPDPREQ